MKGLILFAALISCQVFGYLIEVPKNTQLNIAKSGWIHKQKLILWLFDDICEVSTNPTIVRLAKEFSTECENSQCIGVTKLKPRDKIYSEFNEKDLSEMKIVYNLLYSPKNFDEFYKAACWARQNVNCGVFVDALYAVLFHRRDTEKIVIPPPYELITNYFVNKNILRQIISLDEGQSPGTNVQFEGNVYTISQNYTSNFVENLDESKLAYFLEDIGLNSYYFLRRLQSTMFIENQNVTGDMRGEFWYHTIKQLIARYNLERYSNGFSEIQDFSFDELNDIRQYDSMLMYSNGIDFQQICLPDDYVNKPEYIQMKSIEAELNNMKSKKDSMSINEILKSVMDGFFFNEQNYESNVIRFLRNDADNENSVPTVLEHYMTMLRDPFYWKLLKSITSKVDDSLKMVPRYARNELYVPGVQVLNLIIKKCTTSFEFFDMDVTNALQSNFQNVLNNLQVNVRQPRLSNKPFTMKVYVTAQTMQKALIKMYLVPKILPAQLSASSFFLLDSFEYTLKTGINVITRSSDQFRASEDLQSMKTLMKNIEDAEFGLDAIPINNIESYINFPSRLLMPKGSPSGIPYQLFVFVAPFTKPSKDNMYSAEFNSATLSPGYPFDLIDDISTIFNLPNSMFKELIITHKGDDKVFNYGSKDEESTKKWGGGSDYSDKKKEPYDYKSKKEKYSKKSENYIETTEEPISSASYPDDLIYEKMISADKVVDSIPNRLDDTVNPTYIYKDGIYDKQEQYVKEDIEDETDEQIKYFARIPSVYDIYRNLNYDYYDNRIYE